MDRNALLLLDDEALARQCEITFCVGSGPGGQKRNKSASFVRVRHRESGCTASDCTERSQHRNRANALRKLRLELALNFREASAPLPRPECALQSPDYPLYLAIVLDHLAESGFDHRAAAQQLGCTPSSLLKKLFRDPVLWPRVQTERARRGLASLHAPK